MRTTHFEVGVGIGVFLFFCLTQWRVDQFLTGTLLFFGWYVDKHGMLVFSMSHFVRVFLAPAMYILWQCKNAQWS